jgi:hypothetical protein
MGISYFFDFRSVWVFENRFFGFQYHLGLYTIQEPSYLGKIA